MKFKTIDQLLEHHRAVAGFDGSWSAHLEVFTAHTSFDKTIAVSRPMESWEWVSELVLKMATRHQITATLVILVIEDWEALCRAVVSSAMRERLLVRITGNLSRDTWERAKEFSGRTDGFIRRSLVGVPVGAPYWYPTPEQVSTDTDGIFVRHQTDYSEWTQ